MYAVVFEEGRELVRAGRHTTHREVEQDTQFFTADGTHTSGLRTQQQVVEYRFVFFNPSVLLEVSHVTVVSR